MQKKKNEGERLATPYRLRQLFVENELDPAGWEPAQRFAGLIPTRGDWLRFIDLMVLALGTTFLIAGVLFFFAFNWRGLPTFGKFAVVEGAVVIATLCAFFFKLDTWAGRMALAASSILVGVTLGVVGTTYQTGADSYNLFVVWTMLITGWVLISRWNVMYLIWMVLFNTSLSLYWYQVIGMNYEWLNLALLSANFGFIVGWDLLAHFHVFEFMKQGRWLLYLLMIPVLIYATGLMMGFILYLGDEYRSPLTLGAIAPLAYVIVVAVMLLLYGGMKHDLAMLTMLSISVLSVVLVAVGRALSYAIQDGFLFALVMGFVTISTTGLFIVGLRSLRAKWEIDE